MGCCQSKQPSAEVNEAERKGILEFENDEGKDTTGKPSDDTNLVTVTDSESDESTTSNGNEKACTQCDTNNRQLIIGKYIYKCEACSNQFYDPSQRMTEARLLLDGFIRSIDITQTIPTPMNDLCFQYFNDLIELSIKTLSGNIYTCLVKPDDKVYDVKVLLSQPLFLVPKLQRLIFAGTMLEDGMLIKDCKGSGNMTWHLLLRHWPQEITELSIQKFQSDEMISISWDVVTSESKILIVDIKRKIEKVTGISIDRQILLYEGRELNDDWSLFGYGLSCGYPHYAIAGKNVRERYIKLKVNDT